MKEEWVNRRGLVERGGGGNGRGVGNSHWTKHNRGDKHIPNECSEVEADKEMEHVFEESCEIESEFKETTEIVNNENAQPEIGLTSALPDE
ncbi:hypothetical protein EVAR_13764_1 [Eumeta japonica]|uniref:Uncharacterized protein n=1 Tax=Eumeta variegata TaxID=151549 RepID=A0A4C1U192_EUMVA|nr:hypothetical protein EVAR_13764_1 [Eumeta japonica]